MSKFKNIIFQLLIYYCFVFNAASEIKWVEMGAFGNFKILYIEKCYFWKLVNFYRPDPEKGYFL